MLEPLPRVSVLMPVRNEAGYIERSLGSVLAQDYPPESLEVIVADGRSSDGTPAVLRRLAGSARARGVRVVVVDNPHGTVPHAMNLALAAACGDVVVRVDGHCRVPPDYVRRCVEVLATTGADCVGGALDTVSDGALGRAIAAAQSSRFGVGGAPFRTWRGRGGFVDTLAFGAYRRDVFDRIGGFDEELERNQDDEFNLRLTQSGGRIWLDPSIRATYHSRATLGSLWRQYHDYGFYKVRVLQKHRTLSSRRMLAPPAFVAGLTAAACASALTMSWLPLAPVVVPYAGSCAIAAVGQWRRPAVMLLLPLAFCVMHVAYGTGFLAGLWAWNLGRRSRRGSGSADVPAPGPMASSDPPRPIAPPAVHGERP